MVIGFRLNDYNSRWSRPGGITGARISLIDCKDLKSDLRKRMRAERERLDPARRVRMDRLICAHLLRLLEQRDDLHIAAYHAFFGEPDLISALSVLHASGRRIHLPVVCAPLLEFRRWRPGDKLTPGPFGIGEPKTGELCAVERLDLVLMPLVAFSANGTRLGMGGGYYDRSLAFSLAPGIEGPLRLGIAYGLQEVDSLPAQSWDVPLDGVITENGFQAFGRSAATW